MGNGKGPHHRAAGKEALKKASKRLAIVKRNLPDDLDTAGYSIVRRTRDPDTAQALAGYNGAITDSSTLLKPIKKWYTITGSQSRVYYIVDARTSALKQGIRVTLFRDMTSEEFQSYQKLVSYFAADKATRTSFIKTNGALVTGNMYAIGYRSATEAYLDEHGNQVAAQYGTYAMKKEAYPNAHVLREQDIEIHNWLGERFCALSPSVFNHQQNQAQMNTAPLLGASVSTQDHSFHRHLFASSVTYTVNGFSNRPHVDHDIADHFAFGVFLPISGLKDWKLATASSGYEQTHGGFINEHYRIIIQMPTIDGIVEQFWDSHNDVHATLRGQWTRASDCQLGTSAQINQLLTARVFKGMNDGLNRLIIDDSTRSKLRSEGRLCGQKGAAM